jgi:hypothetical protein
MMLHNISLKDSFKSVAAAFFGVQNNQNREKDFSQGKLKHFIIAGVIGVIVFIVTLMIIVSLVLAN